IRMYVKSRRMGMLDLLKVSTIFYSVRIMYMKCCFTDEYQDVCKKQKNGDVRFAKGIYHLLQRKNNVYEML
ncbi:hypothetical protein CPA58_29670, partial [Klebsiella pneumoniae]